MIKKNNFLIFPFVKIVIFVTIIIAMHLLFSNIVKQSNNRKILADINNYFSNIITFNLIFSSLPGDMPNAYKVIYGESGFCDNKDVNLHFNGCNGNGDGDKEINTEEISAWQHLELSGLLSKEYYNNIYNYLFVKMSYNIPPTIYQKIVYRLFAYENIAKQKKQNGIMVGYNNVNNYDINLEIADIEFFENKIDDNIAS